MKILITNKEGEIKINCDNISVKDGMLIIEKPSLENGSSSEELWFPISNISMINFIDKTTTKKD